MVNRYVASGGSWHDVPDVYQAAYKIRAALEDYGPYPAQHVSVMRRHRQEWPTLWVAIEELVRALP